MELSPAFAKGYSRRGAALLYLLRFDEAIDAYKEGLKISSTDAGLLSGLKEAEKAKEGLRALRSTTLGMVR